MSRKKTRQRFVLALTIFIALLGIGVIVFLFTQSYRESLVRSGSERLITKNWEVAEDSFLESQPNYTRKFAFYQLKENENLNKVAEHFSVDINRLRELNPGEPIAGTTIKVPPIESQLEPVDAVSSNLANLRVDEDKGFIRVKNDYKFKTINLKIPDLAEYLKSYGVFTKDNDKEYTLNKPLLLEENIRLDITQDTVEKLNLKSNPGGEIVCLCFKNASGLIKNVTVTSLNTRTREPDYDYKDKRSYIRALASSRLDIVNSTVSYLGTALEKNPTNPIQREGGTYGASWRISDDSLGKDLVTGWVENSVFDHNHFGAYTFGASGMMWKGNIFENNDVYGLDPHDDSNNALIENNTFRNNGKHGFIVSKRCNYNIIRNNKSHDNGLHGFMLHQDSAFNTLENNLAYNNTDNFAIYASNYNMVKNNQSYDAKGSHVRVNAGSTNTYIINNKFYGGNKGVHAYDAKNIYVSNNTYRYLKYNLKTNNVYNLLFANNVIEDLAYKLDKEDRLIFGPNTVDTKQ